jgi:hypothetical protein
VGPTRTLYGALFAAALALTLHAGVDWDWEMPAVMIWLFALGGAALAAPARRRGAERLSSIPARALIAIPLVLLALVPAHVSASQSRLNDSLDAYRRGNCEQAVESARSSISALGNRPEPFEVIGYCYVLNRQEGRAVGEIAKAVDRDPDNWEYRYDLALARGASGLDPRPAARAALRLDPLEPLAQAAVRRFNTADPKNGSERRKRSRARSTFSAYELRRRQAPPSELVAGSRWDQAARAWAPCHSAAARCWGSSTSAGSIELSTPNWSYYSARRRRSVQYPSRPLPPLRPPTRPG